MPCSDTINRKRNRKKKAVEKVTFTPPPLFDLSQWSKQADRTTLGVKGSAFKSFAISCTLVARSLALRVYAPSLLIILYQEWGEL